MIEWPARIPQAARHAHPLRHRGHLSHARRYRRRQARPPARPLDGISLAPLFDGRMERREKPLGFWVYPGARHRRVKSEKLLAELRREQTGEAPPSPPPPDPGKIASRYPEDAFPGPAALIDGDYKLHRPTGALHNLAKDPVEKVNLAGTEPERVARMTAQLEAWQKSVVRSLNGEDYR